MILNKLFELKYFLIEQLEKLEKDEEPTKNEIKSATENVLYDTTNLSKLITSEPSLFNFNVEATDRANELGIDL